MSEAVYHAIPFEDNRKPLLEADNVIATQTQAQMDTKLYARFKSSSLILGLLVGFFIQFSTLGANFLVITLWGEDVVAKSKRDIVAFSLLWSFFTSAMAIVILGFLRSLVTLTYAAVGRESDDILEEMILHMECRFVVGALIGVCLAWTATDILLGMRAQIVYSLVTLIVALFWCRVMMCCFAKESRQQQQSAWERLMMV